MASRIRQLEVAATIAALCSLSLWTPVVHAEPGVPSSLIEPEVARSGAADIAKATKPHLEESYGKLPLSFEANVGHPSRQVALQSRGQGYPLSGGTSVPV